VYQRIGCRSDFEKKTRLMQKERLLEALERDERDRPVEAGAVVPRVGGNSY
jgi:hypothetical protein